MTRFPPQSDVFVYHMHQHELLRLASWTCPLNVAAIVSARLVCELFENRVHIGLDHAEYIALGVSVVCGITFLGGCLTSLIGMLLVTTSAMSYNQPHVVSGLFKWALFTLAVHQGVIGLVVCIQCANRGVVSSFRVSSDRSVVPIGQAVDGAPAVFGVAPTPTQHSRIDPVTFATLAQLNEYHTARRVYMTSVHNLANATSQVL